MPTMNDLLELGMAINHDFKVLDGKSFFLNFAGNM